MKMVVGGAAQGKRKWAQRQFGLLESQIQNGGECPLRLERVRCLDGFHRWVLRCMKENVAPEPLVEEWLRNQEDPIILTDEIGCGVVPMEEGERQWREVTGRLCCQLAEQSQEVYRVFCGLAVRIK